MQENFDIVIRNTSIVDGSGSHRYPGVDIRGDRIQAGS